MNAAARNAALKEIRSIQGIAATFDAETGEFRVTKKGLSARREERVAYYTDNAEDAVSTARAMAKGA